METKFVVSSELALARSLIATYLRREYRQVHVIELQERARPHLPAGVCVEIVPSGRWMFVARDGDANGDIANAMASGASAAISMFDGQDELRRAVAVLVQGNEFYLTSRAMRQLAGDALGRRGQWASPPPVPLTAREQNVLALVGANRTNQQIADELGISVNTVRTHLHSLTVKLGTPNRAALVTKARLINVAAGDLPTPNERRDLTA